MGPDVAVPDYARDYYPYASPAPMPASAMPMGLPDPGWRGMGYPPPPAPPPPNPAEVEYRAHQARELATLRNQIRDAETTASHLRQENNELRERLARVEGEQVMVREAMRSAEAAAQEARAQAAALTRQLAESLQAIGLLMEKVDRAERDRLSIAAAAARREEEATRLAVLKTTGNPLSRLLKG